MAWTDVAGVADVPPSCARLAFTPGRPVALFNVAGNFHAMEDGCPHAGSSLSAGRIDGGTVTCRAHGLRFDIATGCAAAGGLTVPVYAVRILQARVLVDLPSVGKAVGTQASDPVTGRNEDGVS